MSFLKRYRRLVQLFDEGKFALVVDQARRFLQESPDDGRLWQICGAACWCLKDFGEALESLEEATVLSPLHPLAQYALADCYVWAHQPDLACLLYEHLGEIVEETPMLASIAARLGALGRDESALDVCDRIVLINPLHHQAYFGMAYYMRRLDRPPQELVGPLSRAQQLAPHLWHYSVHLAFAWADAGDHHKAHDLLKSVPLEAVTHPCWLRRMREVFEKVGDRGRCLICKIRFSRLMQ